MLFVIFFQCSDKLGLSLELGSFAAGVMISTTDLGQHTLEQVCFCISQLFSSVHDVYGDSQCALLPCMGLT